MQQQPYAFNQQFRQLRMIPVTNKAEANSTPIDYSGTPIFFYNQSTGEIYKKQFDISTGLATFQEFIKAEPTEHEISNENTYLDMETYKNDLGVLFGKLDGLESMLKEKGVKNAK